MVPVPGEKRYRCGKCSKAFAYPESLRHHQKVHVDPSTRAFERTTKGTFRCKQCGHESKNRSNIVKHVKRRHLNVGEGSLHFWLCCCSPMHAAWDLGWPRWWPSSLSVWWKAHDENPWQFAWARCWPRFRHRTVRCRKEMEHVHAGEPPSSPSLPSPPFLYPLHSISLGFDAEQLAVEFFLNIDTQELPSKPSSLLTPSPCPNPHSPSPLSPISRTPDERPPWRETTSLLRPLSEPICFTFPCKWTSVPRTAPPPPPLLFKNNNSLRAHLLDFLGGLETERELF